MHVGFVGRKYLTTVDKQVCWISLQSGQNLRGPRRIYMYSRRCASPGFAAAAPWTARRRDGHDTVLIRLPMDFYIIAAII